MSRFLGILGSIFSFLIFGFFFFFFLVGISASNGFETEDGAIVSSGGLAKIFIIPLAIGFGFLTLRSLVVVLSPIGSLFVRYTDGKYVKDRTNSGRYSSGGELTLAYIIGFGGILLGCHAIATGRKFEGLLSVLLYVGAALFGGVLEAEQFEASRRGASTLRQEIREAPSMIYDAGIELGRTIYTAAVELANSPDDNEAPLTSIQNSDALAIALIEHLDLITETYRPMFERLFSNEVREKLKPQNSPVSSGRQKLVLAYRESNNGSIENSRVQLRQAARQFDCGAVYPSKAEWFIDGPEWGRAQACMWNGIARSLQHLQAIDYLTQDLTKSDCWFGMAVVGFIEIGDQTMTARTLNEWAESRRLVGDISKAGMLFRSSALIFLSNCQQERAGAIEARISQQASTDTDSGFFLGRPQTEAETKVLTSVLGGRNTQYFYGRMR